MKGYLLDTSAALIALTEPDRLSPAVRKQILAGPNFLSVVSFWEVVLKSMKGTLDVGNPRIWWNDAIDQLAAAMIPLRPEHIAAVYTLPLIHKDPFDRVLIAQALTENLGLVTTDTQIVSYTSDRLEIVR